MAIATLGLVGAPYEPSRVVLRRQLTLTGAALAHGALGAALVVVPLFQQPDLPEPAGVRAVLVSLPGLAAPPPPPPPAPARSAAPTPRPSVAPARFVAPAEVPDRIADDGPDVAGLDEGVPGGVPGGVEGGVVGGVIGGAGDEAPPEEPVVRVGGMVHEPRVLRDVMPEYPPVALAAHVTGLVILELRVGRDGVVKDVTVLRADPLFAEAAVEAVRRRLYQPLLLDGVPTDFIITATVRFNLKRA